MKKLAQLLFLSAIFLLPLHSHAASFNCAKAKTWSEKTICSTKQLSSLDDLLAVSFKKALASTDDKSGLKAEQLEWLTSERDSCDDVDCLKGAYTSRLAILNEMIASAEEPSTDEGAGWYKATAKPNLVVRGSADVTGKKLGTVPYGGKVQVLAKTANTDSIGGRDGTWVKIQWQNREAYAFDAFLEKLSASGSKGADKPKNSTTGKTIQGVIDSYECGDNCYLSIIDKQGEAHSGLCTASLCDAWNEVAEMPAKFKNKKVKVSIGRGIQYDGGGNVMGEMDAFEDIILLN